jgi:hypothetical protein
MKEVIKRIQTPLESVYLFLKGNVKDLREELNIPESVPDKAKVIKMGKADILLKRTSDHEKTAKCSKKENLEFICSTMIDKEFLFKAETEIKEAIESLSYHKIDGTNEVFCVSEKKIESIEKIYRDKGEKYRYKFESLMLSSEKQVTEYKNLLEIEKIKRKAAEKNASKSDTIIESYKEMMDDYKSLKMDLKEERSQRKKQEKKIKELEESEHEWKGRYDDIGKECEEWENQYDDLKAKYEALLKKTKKTK